MEQNKPHVEICRLQFNNHSCEKTRFHRCLKQMEQNKSRGLPFTVQYPELWKDKVLLMSETNAIYSSSCETLKPDPFNSGFVTVILSYIRVINAG